MKFFNKIYNNFFAPLDTEAGALSSVPNFVIVWSIFMSGNAILQAIADIVVEVLMLMELTPFKLDLRLAFFFLTIISAVIAYFTMVGMREGDLDMTKSTLILGLFVESSLVISDIYYLLTYYKVTTGVVIFRLPFMILTTCNIAIISYILYRRHQIKSVRPAPRF